MASEGEGQGGVGNELMLGWAHRQLAVALWGRVYFDAKSLDWHFMSGAAVRWWSASLERLYVEGRLGHDLREIGEYEAPDDGPEDSNRDGAFIGAGLGFELVRHPIVVPLDLRVGVDYIVQEDDQTHFWAALGLTFY